jgi:hypothetical protein
MAIIAMIIASFFASRMLSQEGKDMLAAYYPLAVGNHWKYCPSSSPKGESSGCATWTVQQMQEHNGSSIFTVWTYPSQSDDEAMVLNPTSEGLLELGSKHVILRTDKAVGESWEYPVWSAKQQKRLIDRFTVHAISSCTLGHETFDSCITIDEDDTSLGLLVRTTYAKSIGPIRYEYFHAGQTRPFSILKLIERKLSR